MAPLLLLLLLLAPPDAVRHRLEYRFAKGASYVDEQQREWWLESVGGGKVFRWKYAFPTKMRRTVVEVDKTAHPSLERVEVIRFARTVVESASAAETEGTTNAASSEGQTFVWRRLADRWGLFTDKGEVTDVHKQLVSHLQNWRDGLLPKEEVAAGDTWEVGATTFLETAGQPVPKGVQGRAQFKLEKVEAGVATISFDFACTYEDLGHVHNGRYTGSWRFDVAKGRDLEFAAKGSLEMDGGKSGAGGVTIRRTFTWE